MRDAVLLEDAGLVAEMEYGGVPVAALADRDLHEVIGARGRGHRAKQGGRRQWTEQVILGELLAQTLERDGVPVERRLNLGGTFICDRAIRSGDIDAYVEDTGTALTANFRQPVGRDPDAVLQITRELYARAGVSVLDPLGSTTRSRSRAQGRRRRSRPPHGRRSAGGGRRVDAGIRV